MTSVTRFMFGLTGMLVCGAVLYLALSIVVKVIVSVIGG